MHHVKFIFWNTGKKNVNDLLDKLINGEKYHVICLAEYKYDCNELLDKLNKKYTKFQMLPQLGCGRIHVLSNINQRYFHTLYDESHYTVKTMRLPYGETLIIAFVHFGSKLFMSPDDQVEEARDLKEQLEDIEFRHSNNNTLILGDLNMNPFEEGIVKANALHAIPCSINAKRFKRTVRNKEFSMFYNPMWNLFGDLNNSIPGTYFHNSSRYINYFWHIFDQVLIRPSLINKFDNDNFKIITYINDEYLVDSKKRPKISDHLPITFNIKYKE